MAKPWFDPFHWVAPVYDNLVRWFLSVDRLRHHLALPASGWLLDAGGGTGRVARVLQPLVGDVVVVDYSHAMLRQAVHKKGLKAVRAQVEYLPFPDGFFSRVVVVDAFHHFHDQHLAVRELWRVLAPGGRLVIEEPNVEKPHVKLIALGERLALMGSRFYPPDTMAALFHALGARVTVDRSGHLNVWVIVDKPEEESRRGGT